jgi:hypothetical protein
MDTVCKDLHKTYEEIFALPYYLIKWHYFNAERRKIIEMEERNDFEKLLVLLVRPDIYEAMENRENGKTVESTGFIETEVEKDGQIITMSTFDGDSFKAFMKQHQSTIKNPVVITEYVESETKASQYEAKKSAEYDEVFFERH